MTVLAINAQDTSAIDGINCLAYNSEEFLARLDEVQEELLYYPRVGVSKMLKLLR